MIRFLIWNTRKCGGNKLIFEYANRLKKRGHEIQIIVVFDKEIDWFPLQVEVKSLFDLRWIRKRTNILVATFWPTAYLSFLFPAKKRCYLVLGWEAEYYRGPLLPYLVLLSFKLPLQLMAISDFLIKKTKEIVPKKDIYLAPVGIDRNLFSPMKITKDPQSIRILSVISAYQRYKGLDNLIMLIKKLKKKYGKKFRFILLSYERKSIDQCFDEFISNVSNERLVEEYRRADLFLAASRVEGFFIPGLEAMACGCPVVTTDSGGVREYAKKGYNCLMATDPSEMLEKKMVETVLSNYRLRNKLVKNGLETARQFDWSISSRKFEKIINE
jgi:glycosyltransferase involved in cell wall biosynthesis